MKWASIKQLTIGRLSRYIKALFLAGLIPALLLGIYAYTNASQTALQNVRQTVDHQMLSAIDEIDGQLDSIQTMKQLLVTSRDLMSLQLCARPDSAEVQRLLSTNALMSNAAYLNRVLLDIVLYTGNEKVVSSRGIFPSEYYFNTFCVYDSHSLDQWNALLSDLINMRPLPATGLTVKNFYSHTGHQVIPIITTFSMVNGRGLLIFTVDAQSITNILAQYMPYQQVQYRVDMPSGGTILGTGGNAAADDSIIFDYTSGRYGWAYTVSVSRNEIMYVRQQMLMQMSAIICCVLVLGFLLVLMLSKRVSHPLSNIQQMLDASGEAVRHQNNSLKALEMQVSRLLDDSSSEKEQFGALAHSYAESIFLTQSINEKKSVLLERVMKQAFGFHGGPYQCAAIRFSEESVHNPAKAQELLERAFPAFTLRYNAITTIYVLEVPSQHSRTLIEHAAQQLCSHMREQVVGIAVSGEISGVHEIPKALNESLTVLQHIENDGRCQLLFSEAFDIVSHYVYSYRDELQLVEALQRSEGERLHTMLDSILLKNYEKCVSHAQIERLFDELRNTAVRYAQQESIVLPVYPQERHLPFDTARAELHQLYDACIGDAHTRASNAHIQLALQANAYIQANYAQDIYLESIARALGVSAKHLSRVYKQHSGMNITDQVGLLRIERAKELLARTNMTNGAIMGQIGFVNRVTFLRTFKRFVGISPSAYRQMHNPSSAVLDADEEDDGHQEDE